MRKLFLILLAGCLAGCATHKPAPVPADVIADPSEPVIDRTLTPQKVAELKTRLRNVRVGMPMEQVMQILDLPSLHAQSYADAHSTGITYRFRPHHMLVLATSPADYDAILRWARFDGEMFPKPHEPHMTQPKPPGAP